MKGKIVVRSQFKDKRNFREIPELRKGVIEQAPETPVMGNFAVNSISNFLHTPNQSLRVKSVEDVSRDARAYILEPDTARGTAKLAYYKPGQSISITVNIKGADISRPFTLCSSPALSVEDKYLIIVNRESNGYVSKYIYDTWCAGTHINASSPFGNFTYQTLRDSKNIIGICDNTGYEPFLAIAEAIADNTINANLTLLYSARKQNETTLSYRFDELAENCEDIKIVYIFSDEHIFNCERGFVTKSLIEKYKPSARYSLFISCSPDKYVNILPQILDLSLDKKFIRVSPVCKSKNPGFYKDFPADKPHTVYLCKVIKDGEIISTLPCYSDETILSAFEKEGLSSPSLCQSGECGFCKSLLIDGDVYIPSETDSRKRAETDYGIIHPCCTYPLSNLVIEIQ